jgi:hypothetical protein
MFFVVCPIGQRAGAVKMNTPYQSLQLSEDFVRETIDDYIGKQLAEYQHIKVNNPKVIHDSVHGTNIFHPYEIAFLDLPIVQRLRRISQTDVASFVFPAGNHNRFEHRNSQIIR